LLKIIKSLFLTGLSILLFTTSAQADWLNRYLSKKSCSAMLSRSSLQPKKPMPTDIQKGLVLVFKNYLKESKESALENLAGNEFKFLEEFGTKDHPEDAADQNRPPFRKNILFNNEKYTVLDYLGAGVEGIVYIAEGSKGMVLIKEFFNEQPGDINYYADLKTIDSFENFLMMEMIVGPTTDTLRSEIEIESHGVSYDLALDIYDYFKEIVREGDFNNIIDLRTGNLVMIDPH